MRQTFSAQYVAVAMAAPTRTLTRAFLGWSPVVVYGGTLIFIVNLSKNLLRTAGTAPANSGRPQIVNLPKVGYLRTLIG